jgi:hypothetical protein
MHVIGAQEVSPVLPDVGAAMDIRVIRHQTMPVQIAEEELIAIRRREKVALINGEPAVRVTAAEGVGVVVHDARAGRFVEGDIGVADCQRSARGRRWS